MPPAERPFVVSNLVRTNAVPAPPVSHRNGLMSFFEWIAVIWGTAFVVVALFYWQSLHSEKKNA